MSEWWKHRNGHWECTRGTCVMTVSCNEADGYWGWYVCNYATGEVFGGIFASTKEEAMDRAETACLPNGWVKEGPDYYEHSGESFESGVVRATSGAWSWVVDSGCAVSTYYGSRRTLRGALAAAADAEVKVCLKDGAPPWMSERASAEGGTGEEDSQHLLWAQRLRDLLQEIPEGLCVVSMPGCLHVLERDAAEQVQSGKRMNYGEMSLITWTRDKLYMREAGADE